MLHRVSAHLCGVGFHRATENRLFRSQNPSPRPRAAV